MRESRELFPKKYKGIQYNYCVSTGCENFGRSDANLYEKVNNDKGLNIYYCPKCGSYPQVIDNKSVYLIIEHQLNDHKCNLISCPNKLCDSNKLAVHSHLDEYRSFGKTNSLKQRYQCKRCHTVFTDMLSNGNVKNEMQNAIFYGMVYSVGVRNICKTLSLSPKQFYKYQSDIVTRLKYMSFVKEKKYYDRRDECTLVSDFRFLNKLNNTMVVATVDNETGYVLGFDINLSKGVSNKLGVCSNKENNSKSSSKYLNNHVPDLMSKISRKYDDIMYRKNYLIPQRCEFGGLGSREHDLIQPYLICFAHAHIIKNKLGKKNNCNYVMRQDTILRNSFINASLSDLERKVDAIFYYSEHNTPIKWFDDGRLHIRSIGWWNDKWGFTSDDLRTKATCYIAGRLESNDSWYKITNDVSLDPVNNYLDALTIFFSGLGKNLNEKSIKDWLHAFTGYYNYCLPDESGRSPAQKLGFIDKPITFSELLSGYWD